MSKQKKYITIGKCKISPNVKICNGTIIGKPFRKLLDGSQDKLQETIISDGVYIGYYSIIGSGSRIGANTIIDDRILLESRVKIGKNNIIIYSSQLCNDVVIGDNCVIGNLIGERTKVGNGCRIFGKIIHSQHDPSKGWDDEEAMEESVIIENNVFIGFNAVVAGRVVIERNSYVMAGAIITKNIPAFSIAWGINKFVYYSKWKGNLKKSPFFKK